jgi:peptidoglycan/xylan/chitin deacetylase (PgdA/CDA1 family)
MASPHLLLRAFQALTGRRARILGYHSVSDRRQDVWSVGIGQFEQHMRWLREARANVISLEMFAGQLQQGSISPHSVIVTFDDGYLDFFENALPILIKYGIPATLFIPTGRIGKTSSWSQVVSDAPLMSRKQIEQVAKSGISLGSHGKAHRRMTTLEEEALHEELVDSRQWFEREFGYRELDFAYPFGDFGPRESSAARAAGYRCATGYGGLWGNGPETDRFALNRDSMKREHDIRALRLILNGSYDWLTLGRALISRQGKSDCAAQFP